MANRMLDCWLILIAMAGHRQDAACGAECAPDGDAVFEQQAAARMGGHGAVGAEAADAGTKADAHQGQS